MNARALRVEEQAVPYLVAPPLTDQIDTFASAPEGFKRLRELVLNLAVRGRLVPQDLEDESAEHLVRKRSKQTDGERQSPFTSLPLGWAFASLSELGDFSGGKTPSTNNSAYWDGAIPWVTPKDMKFRDILDTQDHVSELALRDGLNPIEAGSVLIVVRSGILRRMLPVAIARIRCTVNQDLKALRLARPEMAAFVQLLLHGHERWILEALTKTGTTVESVKFDELAECLFPLPPLAEQSRIVAKVEELMALIDRLEARVSHGETARGKLLDALLTALADSPDAAATADAWAQLAPHFDLLLQTPADVDRLQQTLLTLAVKGRLVPQDPNDEPAAELLKRIRAERERLVSEGHIKREKPLPRIESDDLPCELPRSWAWVRWGDVCLSIGDIDHKMPEEKSDGVPYVSPRDFLPNNQIDFVGAKKISKEDFELLRRKTQPARGDIIFPRYGTIGENRLVATDIDFLASYSCAVIRPSSGLDPTYNFLYSVSSVAKQDIALSVNKTTQANVGIKSIKEYRVPLPPAPEQSRIVAAVASLTALCDRLRERLAARRALSAKLATALTETALQ